MSKPFYDRDQAERISLTEAAMAERRTVRERWIALAAPEGEPWSARAALAAEILADELAVVDLGCGTMTLERYLSKTTAYHPVDVVARDTRTIVCDVNAEPPPSIDAQAVVCLGLLEYVLDPAHLMRELSQKYSVCVISYCISDAVKPLSEPRRAHAWFNDFTQNEVETLFTHTGWVIVHTQAIDNAQMVWRLESKKPKKTVHQNKNSINNKSKEQKLYIHSHHKCASRWMIAYLAKTADINARSFTSVDRTDLIRPSEADWCLFGNSAYETAASRKLFGIHIVRNPLSILLSAYYSHLTSHPTDGWSKLERHRAVLRSANLVDGLYLTLAFLEQDNINDGAVGPLYALRRWDYSDPRFLVVRMEDAVGDPSGVLGRALGSANMKVPNDADFRFEAFADGRSIGDIRPDAHYRSGLPHEWRDVLPQPLINHCRWAYSDLLERYYPEVLS
ncbi:hypothetical protein G3T14_19565 [Methylobacterium sp. BTF04]|uniref:hypothetical protein n=1 Tax=Methylobacterium sp. BTF04 TaxID=2708300 RepID=UPI0013D8DB77|nr:hypothetical protein [Methylobacterium sp. BTF04]NEU14308.1 hypothetical protein [Methylobacterium sp. BTF04]